MTQRFLDLDGLKDFEEARTSNNIDLIFKHFKRAKMKITLMN